MKFKSKFAPIVVGTLIAALGLVALPSLASEKKAAKAVQNPDEIILRAQGNPLANTFLVLSNKRADLRLLRATEGTDRAFTIWLRNERPQKYQEYARAAREKQRQVAQEKNR